MTITNEKLQAIAESALQVQRAADEMMVNIRNLQRAHTLLPITTLYLSTGDLRLPESVRLEDEDAAKVLALAIALLENKIK